MYPAFTWHKSRKKKHVYLTFDDGPIPVVTPFVLNTLKNFSAMATFFCIGDNVTKFPEIYADVLSNGHSVGNHTFNHLKGWSSTTGQYLDNTEKCSAVVKSKLFRPPYGRITAAQSRALRRRFPDMEIIMWDVLSGDFDLRIDGDRCVNNVLKHCRNGSIIVFHDSVKAFPRLKYALPRILHNLSQKGFEFKAL